MAADVILLNGPSSAGKSSLARALQDALDEPWLTFGVDALIHAMPLKLDGSADGLIIHPGGRIEVGPTWRALEGAWRRGVGALARTGLKLVLDEVIFDGAEGQRGWNEALAGLQVLWVAVRCDPQVLAARESARGDRVVGMAVKQAAFVHTGIVYDLEVDTGRLSPEQAARLIVERAVA
jgi:chloramphenicol 3-O phosphotransferase